MQINIDYRPSYATAKVALDPGEDIVVEGGAMVAMSSDLELQTKARGGFLKSLGRATFGGESFFLNTYSAPASGGTVYLAPALPGDMKVLELSNETLMVQSGGYIASSPAERSGGGAEPRFFGEDLGFFTVRLSGSGSHPSGSQTSQQRPSGCGSLWSPKCSSSCRRRQRSEKLNASTAR